MKIKIYTCSQSVRSIRNGWNSKYIPSRVDYIIKLRDRGNLLGVCYLRENTLYGLIVNPNFRGKGYGKILIEAAEKIVKKKFKELKLTPKDNNPKLRKYYESLGFVSFTNKEKCFEEEDKSWWVMTKQLRR